MSYVRLTNPNPLAPDTKTDLLRQPVAFYSDKLGVFRANNGEGAGVAWRALPHDFPPWSAVY
jgi:hypothetical protein